MWSPFLKFTCNKKENLGSKSDSLIDKYIRVEGLLIWLQQSLSSAEHLSFWNVLKNKLILIKVYPYSQMYSVLCLCNFSVSTNLKWTAFLQLPLKWIFLLRKFIVKYWWCKVYISIGPESLVMALMGFFYYWRVLSPYIYQQFILWIYGKQQSCAFS